MSAPQFPAEFIDELTRAVESRDGTPERDEVRFRCPDPNHEDTHPSARWNPGKAVWICDVCGKGGGALDLADLLGVEKPQQESDATGLTLAQLASVKHLAESELRQLGLRDAKRHGRQVVVIPYLDANGDEKGLRYRLAIGSGQRFSWRSGDHVMPYGLHRLADIRKAGTVLLVEGESDCWTCWHHGVHALGMPGKGTWKSEWLFYLNGLDVYLWQEPDAADFAAKVGKDVTGLRVIVAPAGTKDLSEAHCRGEDIRALVDRLMSGAVPVSTIASERLSGQRGHLWSAAATVLEADDPLTLVEAELKRLGYGGDIGPAAITYLCLTTRLLKMRRGAMPAHLLLLGPPSTGKSYTLFIVLLLFPPEAYHVIDAGSPRVLIYDDAVLEHKILVFSEADSLPASEDNPAASAIRNLLQDHYLHYQVTTRDAETGDFVVREIEKPGPTALVTTAVKSLGTQMMSRIFALPVPEDVKRLQEALATQAALELDGAAEPNDALRSLQGYLQTLAPWDVVVPFAKELATAIGTSANASRILRDYQRLLSLVKAVTILRHRQRDRTDAGRFVATIADYRAVYDLVGAMFETSTSGLSATIRAVVGAVDDLTKASSAKAVTYSAVARKINLAPEQVKRAAKIAIEHEWLGNDEDKANRPARLKIGEPLPAHVGLPTPEAVAAAFAPESPDPPEPEGLSQHLHQENADGVADFTVSQPDRREHAGRFSRNGASANLKEKHPPSPDRSACETVKRCADPVKPCDIAVKPQDDPRFAATVANQVALSAEDFAALGDELAWLNEHQPDVDDLAFDLAAYKVATRRRQEAAR